MKNKFLASRNALSRAGGGLTLVELLIAISLVGMVMIAVVSVDVAARNFLTSAELESGIQNQIFPVLDQIAKEAMLAYGDVTVWPTNSGARIPSLSQIIIRNIDTAATATYSNYADDPQVTYGLNPATRQLTMRRRPNGGSLWGTAVPLINEVSGCEFRISPDINSRVLSITITARRDASPGSPMSPNPTVRLETSVSLRTQSIR